MGRGWSGRVPFWPWESAVRCYAELARGCAELAVCQWMPVQAEGAAGPALPDLTSSGQETGSARHQEPLTRSARLSLRQGRSQSSAPAEALFCGMPSRCQDAFMTSQETIHLLASVLAPRPTRSALQESLHRHDAYRLNADMRQHLPYRL